MFEQLPGNTEAASLPLKGIVVSAVGLLGSLGLCGAGGALNSYRFGFVISIAGIIVFFLSVLGLVGSFTALLFSLLFNRLRR